MESLNTKTNLFILVKYLNKKFKLQIVILFFIILISAFSDLLSVFLIAVFLNKLLGLDSAIGFESDQFVDLQSSIYLFEYLEVYTCSMVLLSLIFRLLLIFIIHRISAQLGTYFAMMAFECYHLKDFQQIEEEPTSIITSVLTNKVTSVAIGTFFPIFNIVSHAATFFILIVASMMADFIFTLLMLIVVLSSYCLIYFSSLDLKRNESLKISTGLKNIAQIAENSQRFASHLKKIPALENFREKLYIEDSGIRSAQAKLLILASTPRYIIEGILWVSILVLFAKSDSQQDSDQLGNIVFVAIALQRLLPSVQQIYSNVTTIAGHSASVCNVLDLLKWKNVRPSPQSNFIEHLEQPLSLSFVDLKHPKILNNRSIKSAHIKFPGWVLINGVSGSGKSTLLKIVAGLYQSKGLEYEFKKCSENNYYTSSQGILANFVHAELQGQDITDSSLIDNLYFTSKAQINTQNIEAVLQIVELKDKIFNKLSEQGDFNIKYLSGGERQRIAICRALLSGMPIAILDETTSGLDKDLERRIFQRIKSQYPKMTFVVVSHGTPNADLFDQIINIEDKES
jgi:ABC-type transport system involved in cytochrome bd biosynthesis fused ATPase/permease subunit